MIVLAVVVVFVALLAIVLAASAALLKPALVPNPPAVHRRVRRRRRGRVLPGTAAPPHGVGPARPGCRPQRVRRVRAAAAPSVPHGVRALGAGADRRLPHLASAEGSRPRAGVGGAHGAPRLGANGQFAVVGVAEKGVFSACTATSAEGGRAAWWSAGWLRARPGWMQKASRSRRTLIEA